MFYEFETYGPFILEREGVYVSRDALETFWDSVEENIRGLEGAIGVYLIAISNGNAVPKPWYVGKTDRGFRRRLSQHAQHQKVFGLLHALAPRGTLEIYFLAKRTSSLKGFRSPAPKNVGSINALEELLIGTCYSRNSQLLNVQKMSSYKKLRVPGYLNDKVGKPSKAASSFNRLLFKK
ncbi:MAG TPA: hypothetical protein VHW70_16365 [Edaphobacter sp.]|jgi:hypothetical protein|nr:hypothetical protein [Edaphobacter sp.]